MGTMTSTQELLTELEAFLDKSGMPPTTFGLRSCNDAHAVRRLREGYGVTMRRADIMRQFMRDYRPNQCKTRKRCQRSTVSA